jgi:ADP-heptose:LPS heptosyltransferase
LNQKNFGLCEFQFLALALYRLLQTRHFLPELRCYLDLNGRRRRSLEWDCLCRQLAEALNALEGVQVLLVGSASEEPLCRDVEALLKRPAFVAAGKTPDLRHLLALIAASKAFLGHDSGPMHLAEALGVPSTVLFGPTVEEFGFYPQGPGHQVFQVDLNCRPCSVHGTERCPLGHHHCMKQIASADVARHLAQVLKA